MFRLDDQEVITKSLTFSICTVLIFPLQLKEKFELCKPGWRGILCERKINFCENITCLNNGICRPLLLNFTCECLGTSYSGRFYEISLTKVMVISKSYCNYFFNFYRYIFVMMDILKYCFGIDPTKHELEKFRRQKARKMQRRSPVIQRFVYLN